MGGNQGFVPGVVLMGCLAPMLLGALLNCKVFAAGGDRSAITKGMKLIILSNLALVAAYILGALGILPRMSVGNQSQSSALFSAAGGHVVVVLFDYYFMTVAARYEKQA